jgi:hypothetical protein
VDERDRQGADEAVRRHWRATNGELELVIKERQMCSNGGYELLLCICIMTYNTSHLVFREANWGGTTQLNDINPDHPIGPGTHDSCKRAE